MSAACCAAAARAGVAVGQETANGGLASLGCQIVATDLDLPAADAKGWVANRTSTPTRLLVSTRRPV